MAAICSGTTSCSGGGHHVLTVDADGASVSVEITEAEAQAPLTAEERDTLLRLLARRLRQQGVSVQAFLHRVLQGDEATNVKIYTFFGPGAAVQRSNVGATPVNLLPGANGERLFVDFTGCTQYRLMLHVGIGSGTWGARVVRDGDGAVLHEDSNLGAVGERELDTDWQDLPAEFLGQGFVPLRVQVGSGGSAAAMFRGLRVGVR